MNAVVRGEQYKAEAFIAANPKLLLMKGKAVDYSGRIIKGTAFQAALGAEDSLIWKMMEPYFKRLEAQGDIESAEKEMLRQFNEQFPPNYFEEETPEHLTRYYNGLAEAIARARIPEAKERILTRFREEINTSGDVITTGKHFNMQHLIAASQAYDDKFYDLATWPNRDMFWQKVIGFTQRQIPAHFAQAHCCGLKNIEENADNFKRDLALVPEAYFPLSTDGGLGFDFAVYSYRAGCGLEGRLRARRDGGEALKNIVEQKQTHLLDLDLSLKENLRRSLTV